MSGERHSVRIATKKMSIPEDLKEYFKSLITPLATTASLEEMFENFTSKVVAKLEKRLDEQEQLINLQKSKLEELESRLSLRQNIIEKLVNKSEIKTDDLEQYSRRSCLRVNGVEVVEGEENINETIEKCYDQVGLDFNANDIDRAHRLGNPYLDNISKKMVQSIIIKYKSWEHRTVFYKMRPRQFSNGRKKNDVLPFRCSLDLTKRRYNLLKDVRGITKHYPQINYAFADVNCQLGIRLNNNECIYFNDKEKLDKILEDLDFVE